MAAVANEEKAQDKKPQVIFVLGGPGSGKGTQCAKMVKDYGVIHLSAGDLLRAERNSGSKVADEINDHIKNGTIVPVAITVGLIKKAMENEMKKGNYLFVIDGFPRNEDNFSGWYKIMGDFAETPFLLFFKCDEEAMTKRILARAEEAKKNGQEVRKDDNAETLKKRFGVFKNETMPVVEKFRKDKKCREVDAMGSIDQVYEKVSPLVKQCVDDLKKK